MNTFWFQSLTNQLGVTATAIDHIITNSPLHRAINTEIFKLGISDRFSIFSIAGKEKRVTQEGKVQITKRLINHKTREKFKNALHEITWDDLISFKETDSAYEAFVIKFTSLYDKIFEKIVVMVKLKTLKTPVSSKTKQGLYDKFLKSKTYEHEISYKFYLNRLRQ